MARRGARRLSNGAMAMLLAGIAATFVALAYASVPLYRVFCQVTGYGGTTQVAEAAPAQAGSRKVTIRFNADVNRDLPWSFVPVQREMVLAVGETGLAFYRATNHSAQAVTGTATFNVTPMKAGPYFDKIACFCFSEQTLGPGQSVDMPVSFFIDPQMVDDADMGDVATITLSYTFFRAPDETGSGTSAATARAEPAPAATN
jgi:cytochrome c oxidase assembly protein subunit 11